MIKVDRNRAMEPSVLQFDNAHPNGEKNKAIHHYESGGPGPIDFLVYKKDEVKNTLRTLFRNKCAYCESRLEHITSAHIEHWRPKNGVKGNTTHKGYYWLASEWTNLLWACPKCNSQGHKGNHFPLKQGGVYAYKSTDIISNERPLLINPCEVNPEPHFEYTNFGAIGGKSDEGRKSVEIYGLGRPLLVGERLERADNIKRSLDTIDVLIQNNNLLFGQGRNKTDPQIKKNIDTIEDHVNSLEKWLDPGAEYVGMSRQLIRDYRIKKSTDKIFMLLTKKLRKSGY